MTSILSILQTFIPSYSLFKSIIVLNYTLTIICDVYRLYHPESYQSTVLHTSLGLYLVIRMLLLFALKYTAPHLIYDDEIMKMTISILVMDVVLIYKSCLWEREPVIVYVRRPGNGGGGGGGSSSKQNKALVGISETTGGRGGGEKGGEHTVPDVEVTNVEALKLDKRRKMSTSTFNL